MISNSCIVRLAYKNFLKGLQGDNPTIAPQFKTWFYIYKNNTVDEEFKNSIHENYFVDVKEIDRNYYEEETTTTDDGGNRDSDLTHVEDVKRDDKEREINVPAIVAVATNDTTNSKDIPDFETLKKTKPDAAEDETRLIDDQLDSSKFDEVVEDRQYVEVPVIKEEILKQTKVEDDKLIATEGVTAEVKESVETKTEKQISKIISETVKETESLEIMKAEARYLGQRQVISLMCFIEAQTVTYAFI